MLNIQFLLLVFATTFINISKAQVGIGTSTPDSSAMLEVRSASKGFLPPRMTIAQRNEITAPTAGLIVWCTECDELQVYNGTIWKKMNGTAACISPAIPNVIICNQTFSVKNLDVAFYRNGDPIPKVSSPAEWQSITSGAYRYYNDDSANYASTYGKLYNWYAVNDSRGLAPLGWHIPSDAEWNILAKCLDPLSDTTPAGGTVSLLAGGLLKEIGLSHWVAPNAAATNATGFTGLPGGWCDDEGTFSQIGIQAMFWSSTGNNSFARGRLLNHSNSNLSLLNHPSSYGMSVRCTKD